MKSVLDGVADTTFRTITSGLQYLGSNDASYDDPTIDADFVKGGYSFQKPPSAFRSNSFPDKVGPNEELILKSIPFYPTNGTDLFGNRTLVEEGDNVQCGENFMDMECFMILTSSQQLAVAAMFLNLGTMNDYQ